MKLTASQIEDFKEQGRKLAYSEQYSISMELFEMAYFAGHPTPANMRRLSKASDERASAVSAMKTCQSIARALGLSALLGDFLGGIISEQRELADHDFKIWKDSELLYREEHE